MGMQMRLRRLQKNNYRKRLAASGNSGTIPGSFLPFNKQTNMQPEIKIIAIGGGEIGRPGYPVETLSIDREIIRLSGKSRPRLLFIPTASSDSAVYCETAKKHFGRRLGCRVDILYLINKKVSGKEIATRVFNSDIVYVGGGATSKLMRVWRKTGTDEILKQACQKGIVLAGVSAGSICWFRWGASHSKKRLSGLGLVNALHCPHYAKEAKRGIGLKSLMNRTPGVAIALDDCCAVEIIGRTYRILSSKPSAKAYKLFWKENRYHEKTIEKKKLFRPLPELLSAPGKIVVKQ